MQYSQEHLKTMVYAEFGGQTECIMGNWKIENGLAAYLPAVIHYHTHFLLTIITQVGGSTWVNTGPMKHWLPFLNNTKPIKIPEKPFLRQSTRFKFTPTKRRLTTSPLPISEPVLKLALPSHTIYSNSLPFHPWHFLGLSPSPPIPSPLPRIPKFSDTCISRIIYSVICKLCLCH